jgi:hypothetical protein
MSASLFFFVIATTRWLVRTPGKGEAVFLNRYQQILSILLAQA